MMKSFVSFCEGKSADGLLTQFEDQWSEKRDGIILKLIDAIYDLEPFSSHLDSNRFPWPRIEPSTEMAVTQQLHKSVSIYDNSGVFKEFESSFLAFLGRQNWFSLLHNSGTNAIQALYFATGIRAGDEVIVPAYTFHATCSPMMLLGAVPVFCDSLPDGTIDPSSIERNITDRTKAVMVSHMWGTPCRMHQIQAICKSHNILLEEDCSHAHGATIDDQMVGTFGDGAAWSLQGQKLLTGGEGGIVVTRHAEWHYRQLLHGHYNKRCKNEIPRTHPLRKFSLTGAGLKNRAHPLGAALALDQLRRLPRFLEVKRQFAEQFATDLRDVEFLGMPKPEIGYKPAWYGFVMNFVPELAPSGCTRESFVSELHRRGLSEVDIPHSTRPLQNEPLFVQPWELLPNYYTKENYPIQDIRGGHLFPNAQVFHESAIKLPVWTMPEESVVVARYIQTILDVAESFRKGEHTAKPIDSARV